MAKAEVEKGVAKIVWKRSPDAVLVELERTPGINGRKKTIVYRGNGASFTDKTVRDGVRYRYEIRASDVAGNMVEKAVTANVDLPALYRPRPARRARAARPRLGGRQGSDLLQRPALPEQGEGADLLAGEADLPPRQDLALRRQAAAARRPASTTGTSGERSGTRAKPQYGKLLGSNSFVVK